MGGECGWQDVKLGEVVELKRGYDLPTKSRIPGNVPIISSSGFSGTHVVPMVKGPGVVTGRYGTIGEVHWVESDYWPLNTALYVRDFKGNDRKFVYYFLKTIDYFRYSDKAAVPGVNRNHLHGAEARVPPLQVQRAIANILGSLDDKIELNRRMNETLEGIARALFKSWFVDFDPVRAKMDGRQPAGMSPEIANLFPSEFEHVNGDLVPKGWGKTYLGDEVDFQTGFAFKSKYFTEKPPGIRLARGMNVKEGEFFWSTQSRYWPEVTSDIAEYLLKPGDVLIGMDGSKVGKNWVRVRSSDLPCLLVQRVARLRASTSIGENFIWIVVGSDTFRCFVEAVKTGTSIPHISGGQIKSFEFLRPPLGDDRIFDRFEAIVDPMAKQADKNHSESSVLSSLRDTLLPKLLSGELRVPEADKILEEVL